MLKNLVIGFIVLGSLSIVAFKSGVEGRKKVIGDLENSAIYEPVVVLELFTSQGCSSCPAADALLEKVKKEHRDNVFALSYHVDYWNYIGWKDPFSAAKYAKKQREYNLKFRNNSNYTPQLVVNGSTHFVGSNASKMYKSIGDYNKMKSPNTIAITNIAIKNDVVSVAYEVKGDLENKSVRVLLVLDERTTSVKRGENRNRTLKNSNIVVAEAISEMTSSSGSVAFEIPDLVAKDERVNVIVLVENDALDITAADKQATLR